MSPDDGTEGYQLNISRLTIDKLGVRLYDRASAVVAELIGNGYDADATPVTVSLPLGTQLDNPDRRSRSRLTSRRGSSCTIARHRLETGNLR